jgi:hypothetical protein
MRHNGLMRLVLALLLAIGIESGRALASSGHSLQVPGATLEVLFNPNAFDLPEAQVLAWVEASACATAKYFDGFPVARATIEIHPRRGTGVGHGTANGFDGPRVDVQLGRRVTRAELASDWVLTHEMVHLGFPSVRRRHHWMEEGLATYVEPIARVRTGGLTAEKAWGDMVRGLPNGLPQPGDHGLDFTPTWGRTYWGGALYFLLADVEIRGARATGKGSRMRCAVSSLPAAPSTPIGTSIV